MAPSFEDHLKNWKAYKIEKFKPTTTDIIENARAMRKFIIIIENVFTILGIEDEESRSKLFKLTDVELSGKIDKAISDQQVVNVAGAWKKLKKKVELFYQIPKLEESARQKFKTVKQKEGQIPLHLHVEILELWDEAGYSATGDEKDTQIKETLLSAFRDNEIRRQYRYSKMPGQTELTISGILEVANVIALEKKAAPTYTVNQVTAAFRQASSSKSWKNPKSNSQSGKKDTCFGCGREGHKFRSKTCPAAEKECFGCKKKGHFKSMCRSKQSGAQAKNFEKKKNYQSKQVKEADNSESSESDLLKALTNVLYLNNSDQ